METLVLDSGYQPVNTVPWTKAVSYIARDRVIVLEEYTQMVHGDMAMPAVVRLTNPISRQKRRVKFSRQNLLARDRSRCQYCGQRFPSSELTYDHVIPRAQGGTTCWENIVLACVPCNKRKGSRTPTEANMKLLAKPERPSWVPHYNPKLHGRDVPPEWRDYWHVELEP